MIHCVCHLHDHLFLLQFRPEERPAFFTRIILESEEEGSDIFLEISLWPNPLVTDIKGLQRMAQCSILFMLSVDFILQDLDLELKAQLNLVICRWASVSLMIAFGVLIANNLKFDFDFAEEPFDGLPSYIIEILNLEKPFYVFDN